MLNYASYDMSVYKKIPVSYMHQKKFFNSKKRESFDVSKHDFFYSLTFCTHVKLECASRYNKKKILFYHFLNGMNFPSNFYILMLGIPLMHFYIIIWRELRKKKKSSSLYCERYLSAILKVRRTRFWWNLSSLNELN